MSRERTPEQRATTVREHWLELCHATVAETAAKSRAARAKMYDYTGENEDRFDGLMERADSAAERAGDEQRRIAAIFDRRDEISPVPEIMPTPEDAERLARFYAEWPVTCARGAAPRDVEKLARLFASLISDAERWTRTNREPDIIADTRGEPHDEPGCLARLCRRLGIALLLIAAIVCALVALVHYTAK